MIITKNHAVSHTKLSITRFKCIT